MATLGVTALRRHSPLMPGFLEGEGAPARSRALAARELPVHSRQCDLRWRWSWEWPDRGLECSLFIGCLAGSGRLSSSRMIKDGKSQRRATPLHADGKEHPLNCGLLKRHRKQKHNAWRSERANDAMSAKRQGRTC